MRYIQAVDTWQHNNVLRKIAHAGGGDGGTDYQCIKKQMYLCVCVCVWLFVWGVSQYSRICYQCTTVSRHGNQSTPSESQSSFSSSFFFPQRERDWKPANSNFLSFISSDFHACLTVIPMKRDQLPHKCLSPKPASVMAPVRKRSACCSVWCAAHPCFVLGQGTRCKNTGRIMGKVYTSLHCSNALSCEWAPLKMKCSSLNSRRHCKWLQTRVKHVLE